LKPLFSPEAADTLAQLERDAANERFVDAIWDVIDLITEHPGSAQARRRALRTPKGHSIWLVPVPSLHDDKVWVVLWQPHDDDVLIAYIGPDDFRSSHA
jgi:hypothetical protein